MVSKMVSKGTSNYDPISSYSLEANIPDKMINSTILEPRKWLGVLERMSLFSLLMHAMPSIVGRAWGAGGKG